MKNVLAVLSRPSIYHAAWNYSHNFSSCGCYFLFFFYSIKYNVFFYQLKRSKKKKEEEEEAWLSSVDHSRMDLPTEVSAQAIFRTISSKIIISNPPLLAWQTRKVPPLVLWDLGASVAGTSWPLKIITWENMRHFNCLQVISKTLRRPKLLYNNYFETIWVLYKASYSHLVWVVEGIFSS